MDYFKPVCVRYSSTVSVLPAVDEGRHGGEAAGVPLYQDHVYVIFGIFSPLYSDAWTTVKTADSAVNQN